MEWGASGRHPQSELPRVRLLCKLRPLFGGVPQASDESAGVRGTKPTGPPRQPPPPTTTVVGLAGAYAASKAYVDRGACRAGGPSPHHGLVGSEWRTGAEWKGDDDRLRRAIPSTAPALLSPSPSRRHYRPSCRVASLRLSHSRPSRPGGRHGWRRQRGRSAARGLYLRVPPAAPSAEAAQGGGRTAVCRSTAPGPAVSSHHPRRASTQDGPCPRSPTLASSNSRKRVAGPSPRTAGGWPATQPPRWRLAVAAHTPGRTLQPTGRRAVVGGGAAACRAAVAGATGAAAPPVGPVRQTATGRADPPRGSFSLEVHAGFRSGSPRGAPGSCVVWPRRGAAPRRRTPATSGAVRRRAPRGAATASPRTARGRAGRRRRHRRRPPTRGSTGRGLRPYHK